MRQGPDYIQFYPTLRCNRSCEFCFNQSLVGMEDMPASSFHTMLNRLPKTIKTLDIIGGEPTLHSEFISLIEAARSSGLGVNLSSNGSNKVALEAIAQADPAVTIGVSINDHDTLYELRDYIKSARPVVKTVYSRRLHPSLIADILLLAPQAFYAIYRDATGRHDLLETVPFPEFLETASRMTSGAGMVYCSGFLPDVATYPDLADVRCPAGTTKLGVMPDGSVYPCNLLFGRPEFLLGNILTDPFEAIWNHRALAFFRGFSHNPCQRLNCQLHADCHGGCPAQSLLLSGDLEAPDPRCFPAGSFPTACS
jgi:radical SAM protein with 4Fe4S-binding SPASM domain